MVPVPFEFDIESMNPYSAEVFKSLVSDKVTYLNNNINK